MGVNVNSLAATNSVGIKNVVFKPGVNVLPRKILIVGSYDPAKVLADNVPKQVLSAEQVGAETGYGFMLHRLAQKVFASNKNIETWIIPQPEDVGAVVADGVISITGPATEKGKLGLYISGEKYCEVQVASGDSATVIAAAINAALNAADSSIPVNSQIDEINDFEVDLTSKSKGLFGNDIDISLNFASDEDVPAGVAIVITDMANGTTNPDIQDALNAIGLDDLQNEEFFTAIVHGYGYHDATLNALSSYNGSGNVFEGNYSKEVARPFRSLVGNTEPEDAGLLALILLTDARTEDRTNGVLAAPGSENHPSEIAALAMGAMEAISNNRAEQGYINEVLSEIRVGAIADRWTNKYDNRDTAVKSGISTTQVKNGALTIQNAITFYRPETVPQDSNGYRSMRNISLIQNILTAQKAVFELDKWKQATIVADSTKVSNVNSRLKVRDVDSVIDELLALAGEFEKNAWIFSAGFTIEKLKEPGAVVLRAGGNGFDITLQIVLSGEAGIFNNLIEFDTSLAVFL